MLSKVRVLLTKLLRLFDSVLELSFLEKTPPDNFDHVSTKITVGDLVVFKEKVFHPPYYPYYEQYKNNIYVVEQLMEGGHVRLVSKDLDPNKSPSGMVHLDELELLD